MGSKASNQKTKKIPEEKKKINIQASNLNEMRNFLSEENKIQKFHNQIEYSNPNEKFLHLDTNIGSGNSDSCVKANSYDIKYHSSNNNSKRNMNPRKILLKTKGGSLNKDIRQYYKFKEVLGGGHFGTVRVAYKRGVEPIKFYAVKSISKKNLTPKNLIDLIKEVEILSSLEHPNIIKFFETYHDQFYFHIVMELCDGKEVFEKIIEEGNITEHKVAIYIYKVLNAISYCHANGITHRDLKPENILFENSDGDSEIKLIDFGLSRKYDSNEKMHTILGTPYYIAPEVLSGEYDEKCDIWSLGAMTYTMLCGEAPFMGESNNEIFKKIMYENLKFEKTKWKDISDEAIDFVRNCMQKKPTHRWTASMAIKHPWFKNILKQVHDLKNLSPDILENLRSFAAPQKLKRLVLKFFVNFLSDDDIKRLRQAFYAIDLDHTGFINREQLTKAFKLANIAVSDEEISKIFEDAEDRNEGKLDYSEFLMCGLNQKKFVDKEKLISAFKYFDIDNNGNICSSDIKNAMLRSGREIINEEEIDKIIAEVSQNQKSITLEEFLKMFGCVEVEGK